MMIGNEEIGHAKQLAFSQWDLAVHQGYYCDTSQMIKLPHKGQDILDPWNEAKGQDPYKVYGTKKMETFIRTLLKSEKMSELISKRCRCCSCNSIQNKLVMYNSADASTIGQWTAWNGNLNADIMVVGQDWGTKKLYRRFKEKQKKNGSYNIPFENDDPTNECLARCMEQINPQWNILEPLEDLDNTRYPLFFTNAVLCYKDTEYMNGAVPSECYIECVKNFLLAEIDIVEPRVIVFLGKAAFSNFAKAAPNQSFNRRIDCRESFYSLVQRCLKNDSILTYTGTYGHESVVVPMFHTGFYGQCNRRTAERKADPGKEVLSGAELLIEDWSKLNRLIFCENSRANRPCQR